MEFTLNEGKELIKFARKNIINYLETEKRLKVPKKLKEKFNEKMGAFVTLNKKVGDEKQLRGCIGITQPVFPLIKTIADVSLSAAFEDFRFPQITDMSNIVLEISILTVPKLIKVDKPEEYLEKIKIGRDGLYIKKGFNKGLLLPQVPIEHGRNWDVKTFLEHTCMKARLPTNAWKSEDTKLYSFQALIFEEKEPNGEIVQKER
ncbi:MAG: TIGR00296 family protein [Candidatus Lokiarchaeota archaeon]|nr:TIGR00296 family protein [Candidatus Lokiarchaeota archaeon]